MLMNVSIPKKFIRKLLYNYWKLIKNVIKENLIAFCILKLCQ